MSDESEYIEEYDENGQPYNEPEELDQTTSRQVRIRGAEQQRPRPVLPIGEVETPGTIHGAVSITRGIGLGNKNDSVYYKVELPVVIQPTWTPEECAAMASTMMNQAKATLYEHAGLSFQVDDQRILHEIVRAHFPAAERQSSGESRGARRRDDDDDRPRGRYPHPADMDQPDGIGNDDWDDIVEHYEDYYDNRADKAKGVSPNGPDFRHKDSGKGYWLKPYRPSDSGGGRGFDRRRASSGRR